MKIIGAIQADVQSDFFHSLGESEHTEVQQHAQTLITMARSTAFRQLSLGWYKFPTTR